MGATDGHGVPRTQGSLEIRGDNTMLRSSLMSALSLLDATLSGAPASAQDEITVTNHAGDSVTTYPRTATGNVPPLRTLVGVATALVAPPPVVVDTIHDEVF